MGARVVVELRGLDSGGALSGGEIEVGGSREDSGERRQGGREQGDRGHRNRVRQGSPGNVIARPFHLVSARSLTTCRLALSCHSFSPLVSLPSSPLPLRYPSFSSFHPAGFSPAASKNVDGFSARRSVILDRGDGCGRHAAVFRYSSCLFRDRKRGEITAQEERPLTRREQQVVTAARLRGRVPPSARWIQRASISELCRKQQSTTRSSLLASK